MKIVCLVKFIPDVNQFQYDYEKNILVRDYGKPVLNPDDACALGLALKLKKTDPHIQIEVVSMAPLSTAEYMKDLLRRRIDKAVLISDRVYIGSDTYSTSRILARYLEKSSFDLILTGSHTLDGDTAHVPTQVAELLGCEQMSNIISFDEESWKEGRIIFDVDWEDSYMEFELQFPAMLGISKDSKYKLPFVRYADLDLDVEDQLTVLTNEDLGFEPQEVGLQGSPTKVVKTYVKEMQKKEKVIVQNDEEGVEFVYQFLKERGFVADE